jgi:hypothetical protein
MPPARRVWRTACHGSVKKEPEFQQAHFRILPGTALQTAIILFFETSMVMLGQAIPKA